jgi:hypothetical protein
VFHLKDPSSVSDPKSGVLYSVHLVGRLPGKTSLWRPGHGWKDNITVSVTKIGHEDLNRIHLLD